MEAILSRIGQYVLFLVALEREIMKQLPLQRMDLVDSRSYLDCPTDGMGTKYITTFSAFHIKLGKSLTACPILLLRQKASNV